MKYIFYFLVIVVLVSCYEDKGNYDYTDINKVDVQLQELYSMRVSKDTTLVIEPVLSQSLLENEDNLSYIWLHSTVNTNFYTVEHDTVCTTRNLQFSVDPDAEDMEYLHYFRLNVYDKTTGIEYPANTTLEIVKPYSGAWMVLHELNGETQLSSVEYIGGDIQVNGNVYYTETGQSLQGKPVALTRLPTGYKPYGGSGSTEHMVFSIFTDDPQESGVYCQWEHFQHYSSLQDLVYENVLDFDYQDITIADCEGSSSFGLLVSGGQFYQIAKAMKVYKPNVAFTGDVNITLAAKTGPIVMAYDEAGRRFVYYYVTTGSFGSYDPENFNQSTDTKGAQLRLVQNKEGVGVTEADPTAIPAGQKMLYVGQGAQYITSNSLYCYAEGLGIDDAHCYVYEFDLAEIAGYPEYDRGAFCGYYVLNLPEGMTEESCFASSWAYDGILFYSSGSNIYRLDFKREGGQSTLIYTHPQGGMITKMKFARPSYTYGTKNEGLYDDYEFDTNRSLGVVVDMGNGTNEFVVLNLSTMGSIGADSDHYPAEQVHQRFGDIADFVFL